MSSMWDKVKNAGHRAKLKGELALVDRDTTARQRKFGVDLYHALQLQKGNQPLGGASANLKVLHAKEERIRQPLEACRRDVITLTDEKHFKQSECEKLSVKQERLPFATTAQEKLQRAGMAVSDGATQAKLQAQMALIDRQVKQRQELFGVQVFDILIIDTNDAKDEKSNSGGGGIKANISSTLSHLTNSEKEIEKVIAQAKSDMAVLRAKRDQLERDLIRLQQQEE